MKYCMLYIYIQFGLNAFCMSFCGRLILVKTTYNTVKGFCIPYNNFGPLDTDVTHICVNDPFIPVYHTYPFSIIYSTYFNIHFKF